MPKTHKRPAAYPPYLEIALTLAALAFLSFVILGSFDQSRREGAIVTLRSE
jgi:hypothetical protein